MSDTGPSDIRGSVDAALVRRLVAEQFPQWSDLLVRPVDESGWDNRMFRLGEGLSVRLPSGSGYAAQVAKEQAWLPVLAAQLPLPIPSPVAEGRPGEGYPFPWSVYSWIEGMPARPDRIDDLVGFARSLARFLAALRGIDPLGAPLAGAHSAYRGAPLLTYDAEARRAIDELGDRIPSRAATTMWEAALDATTTDAPVWFHGDVAAGNLLVEGGQLSAVIDFGCGGVGDPACDLAIAWTLLRGPSRHAFREELGVGDAEWARGRGWALWKALITLAGSVDAEPGRASSVLADTRSVLTELLEPGPASASRGDPSSGSRVLGMFIDRQ